MAASLGPIRAITVSVANPAAAAAQYIRHLGYRDCGHGEIDAELAAAWDAPGMAGRAFHLACPAASDDFVFRFIAHAADEAFVPFATHGWHAAELVVQDVDSLEAPLADSPFAIVGRPQNLSFTDDIRAMQVRGPGGELLYLTEIKRPVPGLDTPQPRCKVDRTFIVILGGASMQAMQDYYHAGFGVPRAPAMDARVQGMSQAFGNDRETRYPIAALPLAGQSFIEADEMPAAAAPRVTRPGELPPGIAMVTFGGDAAGGAGLELDEPPYHGRCRVETRRGAAGELIEIVSD